MKFLILNTDYLDFLRWLYAQHPGLENAPYEEQMRVRVESLFGAADFLSSNLCKLGHEAWDVYFNNEFMQKAWAHEHGVRLPSKYEWRFRLRRGIVPWISRMRSRNWFYEVLAVQIKYYKPDVLLNWAMDGIPTYFLQEMKNEVGLLIGQAEPPTLFKEKEQDWRVYDLVLLPSEGLLDYFQKHGVKAELLRFGFDPRVLLCVNRDSNRTIPVSFIGSIGKAHSTRSQLLEVVCDQIDDDILIWAPSLDRMSLTIRNHYQGPAWGKEVYSIMSSSRITLNCHIDIAAEYADNMRLYEATAVGTLLITDWKVNLHEMFEPGKEVVAYRTPEECVELVRYYLEHNEEREAIARAGQQRTHRDHTYYHRMQELVDIVRKYL